MGHIKKLCWVLLFIGVPSTVSAQVEKGEPWLNDYSGEVKWRIEKVRLDNFAIQIMNDPEAIGYILIYSGADSCLGEAEARAIQIKRYLTNIRKLPWNRILWSHGGQNHGKGLRIHLVPVPPSALSRGPVMPYEPLKVGQIIKQCTDETLHRISERYSAATGKS